jgi:hypothetical protein
VFALTWNLGGGVGGAFAEGGWAPPESLHDLLPVQAGTDVVCVAAQECQFPVANDLQGRPLYKGVEDAWAGMVTRHLGPAYVRVAFVNMMDIRLLVFVMSRHAPAISNVVTGSKGTGIGNVMANKGGVFISFKLHATSLCFLNCHLEAHFHNVEERNLGEYAVYHLSVCRHWI